jgi:hypothetical protein
MLDGVVGVLLLLGAYFLFVESLRFSKGVTWRFWVRFLAALLLLHFGLCYLLPFYGDAVTDVFHELGFGAEENP